MTQEPSPHGQQGHVHTETAGQEGSGGDKHPSTDQQHCKSYPSCVGSKLFTYSPVTEWVQLSSICTVFLNGY